MDFFDDFSVYSYAHYENALNIGWNICGELENDVSNDSLNDLVKNKFLDYLDYRVNMMRGRGTIRTLSYKDKDYFLGCAEIRVIAKDATVYAIPDILIELIANGWYSPPDVLVDAVLYGVNPKSEEYSAYMKNYTAEQFWGASKEYITKSKEALSIVASGNASSVSHYLDNNPDALTIITDEGSILNAAIKYGLKNIAQLLLERKIPLNRHNGREVFTAIDFAMEDVAVQLIDQGVSLLNYSPQCNPLFYAILKHSNIVAEKLAKEQKHLSCTYNTPYVRDCNVLQWCIQCKNKEMFNYITEINRY